MHAAYRAVIIAPPPRLPQGRSSIAVATTARYYRAMLVGTCDRCPANAIAAITTASEQHLLCRSHATDIADLVDELIADGMEFFSPEHADHCPNCLFPFAEELPIIIRIGPWRRHALCVSCASPILDLLKRQTASHS